MLRIYGVVLLTFLLLYCLIFLKKEGVLFIFNYGRLGLIIWTLGLGLYDLKLSDLYHPDFFVNFIGTIIILNFAFLAKFIPMKYTTIIEIFEKIKIPRSGFMFALYFNLILGIISFLKNYKNGLLRFFSSNKGMRADISLSYFFHSMVVVSICFYILFREAKSSNKKVWYLMMCLFTAFLEFTNLARGPLIFLGIGILYYEIYKYLIKKRTCKFTLKHAVTLVLIMIVSVWAFGAIGDSRTISIFGTTATNYYKMPHYFPSGLTWIYIYITSPLENLRYSLANDIVTHYAMFNKLLYPIIKFVANILGQGINYASYVNSFNSITPYLWTKVGLNMSTFVTSAYADAGYFGIFIYLIVYDLICLMLNRIIISKKINNISKIIIIPLVLEIPVWSIFTNSILGVTSIWSDIIFILCWNMASKFVLKRRGLCG